MSQQNFLLVILFSIIPLLLSSQEKYTYYVTVSAGSSLPEFEKINNLYSYSGKDKDYENFFKEYDLLLYEQSFPDCPFQECPHIYTISTTSKEFINELFDTFPNTYIKYEDISGFDPVLTESPPSTEYYPNDYGTTSPYQNYSPFERRDLDYIGARYAWAISTGEDLSIGFSDARIELKDDEFLGKVTLVDPHSSQNSSFDPNTYGSRHGTTVAGVGAARGDNAYGMVGISYDSDIVMTRYGVYNNLFKLIDEGAKVINMSWVNSATSPNYSETQQELIKKIIDSLGVTLIAAAGNYSSFQTNEDFLQVQSHYTCNNGEVVPTFTGVQHRYPASYDGVISVSTVDNWYNLGDPEAHCCTSPLYDISLDIKDSFSNSVDENLGVGLIYNGYPRVAGDHTCNPGQIISPNGLVAMKTINEYVDILAPSKTVLYGKYLNPDPNIPYYGGATSSATPFVTGTVALMKSLNDCLTPYDLETILKLTTRDVEHMEINSNFFGLLGVGSLQTGSSVRFANEMKKSTGNAFIKDHIFYRYNFSLSKFNNYLTIDNVTFKDSAIANFTAKKVIHLKDGTHLKPDENGYTHLKIDENLDICPPYPPYKSNDSNKTKEGKNNLLKSVLYPNPNNGIFTISLRGYSTSITSIEANIYDVNGSKVFNKTFTINDYDTLDFSAQNLSSGIYFIKIKSIERTETFKFIKN